jgi:anaerobic selenocysteine-containing dehydrogenase
MKEGRRIMSPASKREVIKTACAGCLAQCGLLVTVEDGVAVKIEGDSSHWHSHGSACNRALTYLERVYHPERLKYPIKRTGERGEGKWQRITWDEALDTIAGKMQDAKEKFGPESIWIHSGYGKVTDWVLERFINAFNLPTYTNPGPVCMVARKFASAFTFGPEPLPDIEYPPACIIIWGSGHEETRRIDAVKINNALKRGTKLVVVDPRKTGFAQSAEVWLKVRPGSDLALCLGLINVIINENLYDKEFVENYTVGFDKLVDLVKKYPPEKVEEITWVPAETVKEAARIYATTKPAAMVWGNAIEQGENAFPNMRGLAILRSITGNLNIPGGDLILPMPPAMNRWDPAVSLANLMPPEVAAKKLWWEEEKKGLFKATTTYLVEKAVLGDDPFHIEMCYCNGGSLLTMAPNANRTYQALMKIPFFAASDLFMNPTVALADVVLPSCTFLEFDFVEASNYYPLISCQQKCIEPVGECWPDHKIANELAKKVGLGEHFWESVETEKTLNDMLGNTGVTFEEFRKIDAIMTQKTYRQHLYNGFATDSKKLEIYSEKLEKMGYDPLPDYKEPAETPFSTPDLTKEYPLVFTNWKAEKYRHSQDKYVPSLRALQPDPLCEISPEAGKKYGIKDGDWMYIENMRGKIKQKAKLVSGMDPRVVVTDWAWWYPERGVGENLYAWDESNINILTNGEPPYDPNIGSWNTKGVPCKIYRAD